MCKNCRFCEIEQGRQVYGDIDKAVMETTEYFAIPSIGGFIKGWTLIIPKNHVLSMKNCYEDRKFGLFVDQIIKKLSTENDRFILFEHGANVEGSLTACGTNHAHLHVVPYSGSLVSQMHRDGFVWQNRKAKDINAFAGDAEYLLYGEARSNSNFDAQTFYVRRMSKPISQYFRRLLAEHTQHPSEYDYKRQLLLENADYTRGLFSNSSYA